MAPGPPARSRPGVVLFGAVDRYLGLLSIARKDWDVAIGHLEAALEANLGLGSPPLASHTKRELSKALWHRDQSGDRARAEVLFEDAGREAIRLGMTWLVQQTALPIGS